MTQILNNAQWHTFTAARRRTSDNGLAMMPTAGPYPQPAVVVALHGGLEYEEIYFVASRLGAPPIVPAPYTKNANRVYLGGEQSAVFPMPEISGVKTYGVAGYYRWGILAPEGLESDFMIGQVPFPGLDKDEYIPGVYFSYTLMNQRMTRVVGNAATPNKPGVVPSLPQAIQSIIDLQAPPPNLPFVLKQLGRAI